MPIHIAGLVCEHPGKSFNADLLQSITSLHRYECSPDTVYSLRMLLCVSAKRILIILILLLSGLLTREQARIFMLLFFANLMIIINHFN